MYRYGWVYYTYLERYIIGECVFWTVCFHVARSCLLNEGWPECLFDFENNLLAGTSFVDEDKRFRGKTINSI